MVNIQLIQNLKQPITVNPKELCTHQVNRSHPTWTELKNIKIWGVRVIDKGIMAVASKGERPPPPTLEWPHSMVSQRMIGWHFRFSLTELHLHMIGQRMISWTSLLIECLRGKAASFYGRLQVRDRDDFNLLKQRLNDCYGHHDPPHTLRQ